MKMKFNKKDIEIAAYFLWENDSQPKKDSVYYWLKAENKFKYYKTIIIEDDFEEIIVKKLK